MKGGAEVVYFITISFVELCLEPNYSIYTTGGAARCGRLQFFTNIPI